MGLSNAERQARYRARQKERGLVQKVGWLSPEQDRAIQVFLRGGAVAAAAEGVDQAATIECLRADLRAAHARTDIALAIVEMLAESKVKKQRIESDVLARVLLKAAGLRAELDTILKSLKLRSENQSDSGL